MYIMLWIDKIFQVVGHSMKFLREFNLIGPLTAFHLLMYVIVVVIALAVMRGFGFTISGQASQSYRDTKKRGNKEK